MLYSASDEGYTSPISGIAMKTIAYGDSTLMTEFRLTRGATLPVHYHSHEQTGYLVSGRIRLTVGEEIKDLRPGDAWCIRSDVEHGADILEDSVAIEVFSPVREDYLPAT